jgi:hypothetical protein
VSAELEAFQALLLEVLAREPDGERALAELRDHPAAGPYRAWVEGSEPRMVGVAAALVARWGVRREIGAADPAVVEGPPGLPAVAHRRPRG